MLTKHKKKQQQMAAEERAIRAKECLKRKTQQQKMETSEKQKCLNSSGDCVVEIKFSDEAGRSDKINLEGMSEQGPAPEHIHKLFYTTEAEIVELAAEQAEESMPIMHVNAEVQTDKFDYMFCEEIYTYPNRDYFQSNDKVHFILGYHCLKFSMHYFILLRRKCFVKPRH